MGQARVRVRPPQRGSQPRKKDTLASPCLPWTSPPHGAAGPGPTLTRTLVGQARVRPPERVITSFCLPICTMFVCYLHCLLFLHYACLLLCNKQELQLDTYSNPCSGHVPPALLFYVPGSDLFCSPCSSPRTSMLKSYSQRRTVVRDGPGAAEAAGRLPGTGLSPSVC